MSYARGPTSVVSCEQHWVFSHAILSREASRDMERSVGSDGRYTTLLANNHVKDYCPTVWRIPHVSLLFPLLSLNVACWW
jgi:hypothetical protein